MANSQMARSAMKIIYTAVTIVAGPFRFFLGFPRYNIPFTHTPTLPLAPASFPCYFPMLLLLHQTLVLTSTYHPFWNTTGISMPH